MGGRGVEAARIWLEMEARGRKREEVEVEVELSNRAGEFVSGSSFQSARRSNDT